MNGIGCSTESTAKSIKELFDHLDRAGQERRRDFEGVPLGRLEIDDQLELGGLHDWQVGGVLALENPRSIDADLTISIGKACSITHEAAGRDVLAQFINRWKPVMVC